MSNIVKKIDILTTGLSVYNYLDSPTKLFPDLAKFFSVFQQNLSFCILILFLVALFIVSAFIKVLIVTLLDISLSVLLCFRLPPTR